MFMIIMSFYVEKYQNFCKKVVIGSLLFFASIAFQLKVPKEGDEENSIVGYVNSIGYLKNFTLFELSFLVRNVIYPAIFQMALHMSRMIDVNPNIAIKSKLVATQKKISRGLVLSELITNAERTKPSDIDHQALAWETTEKFLTDLAAQT